MFFKYIKNHFLKRILKKGFVNVNNIPSKELVKTVGVLIDGDVFLKKDSLIKELINNGIAEKNIEIVVYKDKSKNNEVHTQPIFCIKNINWKGEINHPFLNDFSNKNFDLLISYYNVEKAFLLNSTNNSKALFKVGFSTIDKRLNHLLITTEIDNYTVFVQELFKYLKILNKI